MRQKTRSDRGSWSCSCMGKNVVVDRRTTLTVVRARKTYGERGTLPRVWESRDSIWMTRS